jgi:hypothetical protein
LGKPAILTEGGAKSGALNAAARLLAERVPGWAELPKEARAALVKLLVEVRSSWSALEASLASTRGVGPVCCATLAY